MSEFDGLKWWHNPTQGLAAELRAAQPSDADKRTWRIEGAMAALHMGNHIPPKAIHEQARISVDLTWPDGAPKNKEGG